jgi:hypothetical protein
MGEELKDEEIETMTLNRYLVNAAPYETMH